MRGFVVGVMLVVCAQVVSAREWYIKQTGVNNSSLCTEAAPCQTFAFMLPLVAAGDTVHLDCAGGLFTQTMRLGVSIAVNDGTAGSPITVKSKSGCVSEIRPGANLEMITVKNTQYWTFENFVVDARNLTASAAIGMSCDDYGSALCTKGIIFRDVVVKETRNSAGINSFGFQPAGDNVTLERVSVDGTHSTDGDFQGSHCVYFGTGNSFTVRDSTFKNCGGWGIQLNDQSVKHEEDGVAGNHGHVIERNRVFDNGRRAVGSGGGITLYFNHADSVVKQNVVYDNNGPGFLVEGGGNSGNKFYHNTIVDNSADCWIGGMDASHPVTNGEFRNNVCESNAAGFQLNAFASSMIVTNNILHDATVLANVGTGNTVSGNSVADPLLVSVAGNDFHLQSASPARGFGIGGLGITSDIDGIVYPTPPDAGCYSFAAPAVVGGPVPRRMVWY